jgi:thioredoxin reductase (NADPH)
MDWRRLEVTGMEELLGHGVYYGAGRSEAADSFGERVVIVGAGNSAGQAVLNFADAGARVTMVVRGDRLGKTMSAYLVERIARTPASLCTAGRKADREVHPAVAGARGR